VVLAPKFDLQGPDLSSVAVLSWTKTEGILPLEVESYYWLLVVASICLGMKTKLVAQDIIEPYEHYSFVSNESSDKSYSGLEKNGSFFSSLLSFNDWPREKKVIALNAATVGAITAAGVARWDYGSHAFRTANEGGFDSDTPYGGADKLGHVFTCYALASVYNRIYKGWGYSEHDAILMGAANSWLTMTLIEIGDGFSVSEGFSWQDEVMNTLGVSMAYLRHRVPAVRERVDFRWEWFPSPSVRSGERFDVLTDYSGQKFLLAFKLDGWLRTGNPILKATEVQVGYYTRGYVSRDELHFDGQHRYGYVGIGLNMTYLLDQLTGHRAGGIFDYIQVPGTYISSSSKLD
jgi:hypothetical protein